MLQETSQSQAKRRIVQLTEDEWIEREAISQSSTNCYSHGSTYLSLSASANNTDFNGVSSSCLLEPVQSQPPHRHGQDKIKPRGPGNRSTVSLIIAMPEEVNGCQRAGSTRYNGGVETRYSGDLLFSPPPRSPCAPADPGTIWTIPCPCCRPD